MENDASKTCFFVRRSKFLVYPIYCKIDDEGKGSKINVNGKIFARTQGQARNVFVYHCPMFHAEYGCSRLHKTAYIPPKNL